MRTLAVALIILASSLQAQAAFSCRDLSSRQLSLVPSISDDEFERVVRTCRNQEKALRESREFENAWRTDLILLEVMALRDHRSENERPVSP